MVVRVGVGEFATGLELLAWDITTPATAKHVGRVRQQRLASTMKHFRHQTRGEGKLIAFAGYGQQLHRSKREKVSIGSSSAAPKSSGL